MDFPPELAIFKGRLNNHWITKLTDSLMNFQEKDSVPTLSNWYVHVRNLLKKEEQPHSELWGLFSKLAWIQADVDLIIRNLDLLIKNARSQKDYLLLFYVGAGISEFMNTWNGLKIMEESFLHLKASKDWDALLDIALPYILILSNVDDNETFKNVYNEVKRIFKENLNSKSEYNYLFFPVRLFASKKDIEKDQVNQAEVIKVCEESGHHFNTGVAYTLLSHQTETKKPFKDHLEDAILQFQEINARNRLIIAYANLAKQFASKAKHEKASDAFSKAFSIVNEISRSRERIVRESVSVYPLSLKAWLFVENGQLTEARNAYEEAARLSHSCNHTLYQIKAEFGLASVFFLESQDELALTHAQKALSIFNEGKIKNKELQNSLQLKYAELLTDLNKLDEVPGILEKVDRNNLNKCSKVYYDYINGKFELNRHNIGTAKIFLLDAMKKVEKCSSLRPTLLITLAEGFLHEYRISEDTKILQEAQEMVSDSLESIVDIPNRAKGKCLSAILLSAQGRDEEAEKLLETLTDSSSNTIPRFQSLAEKILENIRDNRIGRVNITPITNIRDVLRYLQDAKTMIDTQPR
ncbi:MAG: hypothetical protein JSV04_13215 [Candidatus Heimdallarchaeota archaeon]|nr:MAG: hypothetical protein JSV04_13215 [Candidatus Heimdallarchaeota archaeon]